MSNHQRGWVVSVCLLVAALLFMGGSVAATGAAQPYQSDLTASVYASQPKAPLSLLGVGMSDLISQTFEFTGAFPTEWQTYDNITRSPGVVYPLTYTWSTTDYTRAQGTRSAVAVGPNAGSVFLPGTVYTDPVDSWMVLPVDLSSVWQAQMDFAYLKPSASGYLTVAVSTDYDPISRTGKFVGAALPQATTWTTYTLPLSSYAGRKVYAAFRYQSFNGGQQSEGPFVDDLAVRANYRVMLPIVSKWMLTLAKSVSTDIVLPGQTLVYSITVNNTDSYNAATGVVLNDTLPVSTTFVSADGGDLDLNGVVTWPGLTVPAGGSVVRRLTVTVPSDVPWGTAIVNKNYSISVPPNTMTMYGQPVTTTVVGTFFDDFSDPTSGWPLYDYNASTFNCTSPGSLAARYTTSGGVNNSPAYGISVACAWNGYIFPAPVRSADPANFTIQADMRSNQDFLFQTSYGLFFNGSEDLKQLYTVRIFQGLDPMDLDVRVWYNSIKSSDDPNDMLTYTKCWTCNSADYAWNTLAVRRQGNTFSVYAGPTGGSLSRIGEPFVGGLAALYMDSNHTRVGVHQGNFEWAWRDDNTRPLSYIFDNFKLYPARH